MTEPRSATRKKTASLLFQNRVTEFVTFGLQIFFIVRIGRYLNGNVFHNLQSITHQADAFLRVVGDEFYFRNSKVVKDLCANAIVAIVHVKTQLQIGFNSVEALLLKFVSF